VNRKDIILKKALVGITPSGYFSFLSKLWTGSTSDRKITKESEIIGLLRVCLRREI